MVKQFDHLSPEEQDLLFKAPVIVSVLASCHYNTINESQKKDAVKLAHFKTFTAAPLLLSYYNEVDKYFKAEFEATVKKYSPFDTENRSALKNELIKIKRIISKLDLNYGKLLLNSLDKYALHVKKAGHSVIEDFIFPIPIPGLSA